VRLGAVYCAPHSEIPGILTVSPSSVAFEPDVRHACVKELGIGEFQLYVELRDILQCGAMVMPYDEGLDSNNMGFFLQVHVRTLDGRRFCTPEDLDHSWCVVFRLHTNQELQESTLLLDGYASSMTNKRWKDGSLTSIPFACLDCVSHLELISAKHTGRALAPVDDFKGGDRNRVSSVEYGVTLRAGPVAHTLLTMDMAESLLDHLPLSARLPGVTEWVLRYTPKAHGTSLSTLYRLVASSDQTLVLLRDAKDHVFGGFAPEAWQPSGRFYGSGEAFVFTFGRDSKLLAFPSTLRNNLFLYADNETIGMGGGGGTYALVLNSDLLRGMSSPSSTFSNPTLSSSQEFLIKDLEIWAFEPVGL